MFRVFFPSSFLSETRSIRTDENITIEVIKLAPAMAMRRFENCQGIDLSEMFMCNFMCRQVKEST